MSIEFICEHCGGTLRVEDYLGGQTIECDHCHGRVAIPMEGETAIIHFTCLSCGAKFRVPASRSGSRTKCPECSAVLEVPVTGNAPEAPPASYEQAPSVAEDIYDEPPPAAPSPRIARHSRIGRRPQAGAPADEEGSGELLYVPQQQKVGAGLIFLFLGIGAAIVIALFVILSSQTPDPSSMPPLHLSVKYDPVTDTLRLTNTMADTWTGVIMTIVTKSGGRYKHQFERLSPREPLAIQCNEFANSNGQALDTTRTPGTDLIIMATVRGEIRRRVASLPQIQ